MYDSPFEPGVDPGDAGEVGFWFAFRKGSLLVEVRGQELAVPRVSGLWQVGVQGGESTIYLGRLHGEPCYATEVEEHAPLAEQLDWQGLRAVFARADETQAAIASRASQLLEWDRTHRFCGHCGTPTERRTDERARRCPRCRLTVYPRISPAMMVLITDGERRMLLARKPQFPANRFSALAGFVEAGESLEQTIARESMEEVGVRVKNIRYFGSQSWPFPNSLMIAFTAQYDGGEMRPDGVEIEEARWFSPEELPNLPDGISISRWMINAVAEQMRAGTWR